MEYSLEQNEQFLKKTYAKALIPCMLSILSGNINILVDGILIGQRLGTDALAAINFSLPVYLTLCIVGSFLVSGAAICASEAIGDNRNETAQALYQMSIFWCVLVSVLMTAAGLLFLRPLTGFLCGDGQAAALAADYIGVTLAGALPKILIYIPFWFLRLDGRNGQVTVMMVVMGVGNVALDLLFLYGFDMGVFGAGLASVLATAAACLLGFFWLCDKKSSFSFGLRAFCKEASCGYIVRAGSPSAMNNLFQTLRVMAVNTMLLQSGGSEMVAAFTAVNCISAFAESVTGGVPQAASSMLGIYSGEHDNGSVRLLLLREVKSGVKYCLIFATVIIAGSGPLARMYGLAVPLRFAFFCLSLGMLPGLLNSILSGYYNVSGHVIWANAIILLRVFLMTGLSLWLLLYFGKSPWWFLVCSELMTAAVWLIAVTAYHHLKPECSRFLLMDDSLEKTGRVINFSLGGNTEDICDASSRITAFCEKNGMLPGQVMRISLAMEELMTLIASVNEEGKVEFDLRVFSLQDMTGIRIRYGGNEFNPLGDAGEGEPDDMYLGIRMIKEMVTETMYQRTFGTNTLRIVI